MTWFIVGLFSVPAGRFVAGQAAVLILATVETWEIVAFSLKTRHTRRRYSIREWVAGTVKYFSHRVCEQWKAWCGGYSTRVRIRGK